MEEVYLVLYLVFIGATALVGIPIVLLAEKIWGESKERDEGLWTAIVFGCFFAVVLGIERWG